MKVEDTKSLRACIVVNLGLDSSGIIDLLGSFQIVPEVFNSYEEALGKQKEHPFEILIVHDDPLTGQGLKLIEEFLKINWMTSAILICNQDESIVHDRAEGLGILGHVANVNDLDSLSKLLTKFKQISPLYSSV